jgi:hypothetical protein
MRGGEIEDLFGQLWWVSCDTPPSVGPRPLNQFWIKRELWESKVFRLKDYYPVHPGDTPRTDQKEGNFAADF